MHSMSPRNDNYYSNFLYHFTLDSSTPIKSTLLSPSALVFYSIPIENHLQQIFLNLLKWRHPSMESLKPILEKYWGYLALFAWIGIAISIGLIRTSPFGLDEEAARGLLFTWTIADNVVNPIVIFGVPDFRALLYAPIGAYWSGNLLAAKIMSLTVAFIAVAMLYRWARKTCSSETALIASALFIISPTLIMQVDSLSAGPYILLGFALGAWLDQAYRKTDKHFGGWYFLQLVWAAILTTLHPVALAYPLVIAWSWYRNPHQTKKSTHIYVGLAVASILALLIHGVWRDISLFQNPIEVLAIALQGSVIWSAEDIVMLPGIIAATILLILLAIDFRSFKKDLLGKMILVSIIAGLAMPDKNWAFICVAFLLYRGFHHTIRFSQKRNRNTRLSQQGITLGLALLISTVFMLQDKNHILTIKHAVLSPEDSLLQSLMIEAADNTKPFIVATQWPGRAMIATRRDAFPLPPSFDDPDTMLTAIKSVTHLAFNPKADENKKLTEAISNLGGETETLAYLKGGVIISVRNHTVELTTQQRLALRKKNKQTEEDAQQDGENAVAP